MPKVGNKEFNYDAKGMAQAKAAAKKSGKPMQSAYKHGGKVKIRGTGAATKGLYARGPMG
jgi:hypothetical protein|tara:strand:- start:609 stop:788 length:180 start_codon:yes stop_codon:yes gene_type:complete